MASSPSAHSARRSPEPVNIFIAAIFPPLDGEDERSLEGAVGTGTGITTARQSRWRSMPRMRGRRAGAGERGAGWMLRRRVVVVPVDAELLPPSVVVQKGRGWRGRRDGGVQWRCLSSRFGL